MQQEDYFYDAIVIGVHDGDTITVDIDLGFGIIIKKQKIRLYGINAPELRFSGDTNASGITSKIWLAEKILNKKIVVKTTQDKKEKYGRWLGEIFLNDENINELMVNEGLAIKYMLDE
jgi:micrococcal nuclease